MYNNYDYDDVHPFKTWMEETREWRTHTHEHIEVSTEKIMSNIDETREEINNNIKASEKKITDKIDTVINNYIISMDNKLDEIKETQSSHTNLLTQIWNKIRSIGA